MKLIQNPKIKEVCVYLNNKKEDVLDRCTSFINETINGIKIITDSFDFSILILISFLTIFFYKALKNLLNDKTK